MTIINRQLIKMADYVIAMQKTNESMGDVMSHNPSNITSNEYLLISCHFKCYGTFRAFTNLGACVGETRL